MTRTGRQQGVSATYDFVAIGVGPFNLGLACLAEPIPDLHGVFLELKSDFDWHPGMLLESSTLQTPFLSDLVSLADPTSHYSFLNYLKETRRLYSFYIRENFFPLRVEYNQYCRWAASKLDNIRFGRHVESIEYDDHDDVYVVAATVTATGERETYRGRKLVLGTGTPPYVPEACRGLPGDAVHSCDYIPNRERLQAKESVTVVGSGQSAAEIYHDLLQGIDAHDYTLTWITRSPRFYPLEYTKLTLEMTSPDYLDYFYALPADTRRSLLGAQQGLYKGIDSTLINEIFDLLYMKSVQGPCPTRLMTSVELADARFDELTRAYVLHLRQIEQDRHFTLATQGLVLATGYRYQVPEFLGPITHRIAWDESGQLAVRRNYRIEACGEAILVQNAELHSHGFGAPDLGLGAYRNSWIIRELLGREHYPIEQSIAFQEFAAPAEDPAHSR